MSFPKAPQVFANTLQYPDLFINSKGDSPLLGLVTASLKATFESAKRCIAPRPRDIDT